MRRLLIFLLVSVFFVSRVTSVQAVMSISSTAIVPAQVIDTLNNTITVTVSSSSGSIGYLRPVFFKAGTTQYFGCATSDTTATYCGADVTLYPQINGSGSLTFTVRADTSSPNFKGSGTYQFKVRRCTASGSCTLDSSEQTVEITQTIVNPTPSPTQSSTTPPTTSAQATSEPTATPAPTAIPTQPTGIILSELMVCPPAGTDEWIELANTNTKDTTIAGWELRDSTTSNHVSLPSTSIPASGRVVFDLTSAMYNNSGDTVKLLNAAGDIVESFSYTSCSADQSWSKQGSTWSQSPKVTKGEANQFPSASPTSTPVGAVVAKTTGKPSPSPAATISVTPTVLDASAMHDDVLGVASDESHYDGNEASGSSSSSFSSMSPRTKVFALGTLGVGATTLVGLGGYLAFQFFHKKRK